MRPCSATVTEMFITLRGCRFDCDGYYSWWNNDRLLLGDIGQWRHRRPGHRYAPSAVIEATSASICLRRSCNSEMSPTSSGVNSTATISCVSASNFKMPCVIAGARGCRASDRAIRPRRKSSNRRCRPAGGSRSVWWNTRRSARLVAVELTPDDVGDISEFPDLPEQIDRSTPTFLR